jgi:glyoxylase-like metal-dependent hydrolase (beta-lactamase superfamily II)
LAIDLPAHSADLVTRWPPKQNAEEAMSLSFDVFVVEPKTIPSAVPGFEETMGSATWPPSTSTLVSDDGGALLIDSLITEQDGRNLAKWAKSHDRELEYVYITHPHADHFLGLPEILATFPRARPVALAESIPAMEEQISPGHMQVWEGFFPGQLTSKPVAPAPLAGDTIPLGGSVATLIPVGTTDTGHSSVVHVPDLSLVVSGDVVYNDTHMWLQGSTAESRASWVRALDAVAALEADTLIAGHRNPLAEDDDARRQIGYSRRYLADFTAALEGSSTPAELIDRMMTTYPDLANPYTLWVAAYDLLGSST